MISIRRYIEAIGSDGVSLRRILRGGITWASLATLAGTAYIALIEPWWIEVTSVPLVLPRLASEFCGYRIAQVSDIHLGDWMNADRLAHIVRLVNAQSPDLIAITGDFVSRHTEDRARALECELSHLAAPDGIVAVLGNHDHRANVCRLRQALAGGGVRELANAVYTIARGAANLHIAGIDDVWDGRDRLDLVLNALSGNDAAILLAHEPDFADVSAATGRFDLQLSGHTHGGQIVAPLLGPLQLPFLGYKYPSGFYQVGEMIQYTNRGVGMVPPFVRFNCRPEITVFRLHAQRNCSCTYTS